MFEPEQDTVPEPRGLELIKAIPVPVIDLPPIVVEICG
jgi:hypothetical protein